jgi:transposase InsO family protein
MRKVARHVGVQPSTISRWLHKAPRSGTRVIPTESSSAHRRPTAINEHIVHRILQLRQQRKHGPQVIHQQLKKEGISVSFSTVYRTLKRKDCIQERSPWKKIYFSGQRPVPEKPGILVETDSIHIPLFPLQQKQRIYIFTLIDVFSRWAYAKASARLSAHLLLEFVREAQGKADFKFECVQSDHGPEFTSHFTIFVQAEGIRHRHSRVRQPNDNAHIERFNRTIQDEMRTEILRYRSNISVLNKEIAKYLVYYNEERLHMGLEYKTPSQVLRSS